MSRETDIVKHAMAAAPSCPGLKIGPYKPVTGKPKDGEQFDGALTIRYRGLTHRYSVEARASLRPETVRHLVAATRGIPVLPAIILVADCVSAAQADLLRKEGIPFLDSAGNAFLDVEGLYVFVSGRRPQQSGVGARSGRLTTQNGLKLVYALLVNAGTEKKAGASLLSGTFRDMAAAANVSLGSVGPVVAELRDQGYVAEDPDGGRILASAGRLLDTWVTAFPERLRPKLVRNRYQVGRRQDWRSLDFRGRGVLWGGEVAAAKMTRYLKPQAVALYTDRSIRDLILDWDLRPDPDGDLELLDVFWGELPGAAWRDCVHPLLAYADLMASRDDRSIAAAKRIYDKHLRKIAGIA